MNTLKKMKVLLLKMKKKNLEGKMPSIIIVEDFDREYDSQEGKVNQFPGSSMKVELKEWYADYLEHKREKKIGK